MKNILSLSVLFFLACAFQVHAEETLLTVDGGDTIFYPGEYKVLNLPLIGSSERKKVDLYIVNIRTEKRQKVDKAVLSAGAGFYSVGLEIKQRPGKYYYLAVIKGETGTVDEHKSAEITIQKKSKSQKPRITSFEVNLKHFSIDEQLQTGGREYGLFFKSSVETFGNVYGDWKVKCSKSVTLYAPEGNIPCPTKLTSLLLISGDPVLTFEYWLNEEDIEEGLRLETEYLLRDMKGKKVASQKVKKLLTLE